ncbi:putative di-, tri-valent inorganic cation transporter [Aspergillus lucknowensis]|uniref:Cation efflux protein n=1 Tax=Aspergillus lucknowensis TaxID=176173 RepID=A0ABR4LQS3_9EURO
MSRSRRLMAAIGISAAFFLTEISAVGFYTHSLALVADAFHYLNDLIGFIVAYAALKVSSADTSPQGLSFGWQRAQVLGAFFNGSLLFALGISIFLQSIERFITLHHVENPKLMLIIGSIGLGLNVICAMFLHGMSPGWLDAHSSDYSTEHHHHGHDNNHHSPEVGPHEPVDIEQQTKRKEVAKHQDHRHLEHEEVPVFGGHDLGMMGVLLHVLGDAANNLGVIVAALVIWLTRYEARYYADPATSMGIAAMILLSAIPLVWQSGLILLESAPNGLNLADVKHDLEKIPGILAAHELHIWRLSQHKVLASVHVAIRDHPVSDFSKLAMIIQECFHAYGIHSVTVQPEPATPDTTVVFRGQEESGELASQGKDLDQCRSKCRTACKELACCG